MTLSERHLIPIVDCARTELPRRRDEMHSFMSVHAVHARRALPGQCVLRWIDDEMKLSTIMEVETSTETSAYAPITPSGTLLLNNGIVTSCFAEFESHSIQVRIYRFVRTISHSNKLQYEVYKILYYDWSWLTTWLDKQSAAMGLIPSSVDFVRQLASLVFHSIV